MKAPSQSVFDSLYRYGLEIREQLTSAFRGWGAIVPYFFNRREVNVHKEVTEQYPDPVSSRTPDDLPARTRGFLKNDPEVCTACGDCVRICPTECISLDHVYIRELNRAWIKQFDVDLSKCISCGLCVEICLPNSLVHTRNFEGATAQVEGMVLKFGKGEPPHDPKRAWEERFDGRESWT